MKYISGAKYAEHGSNVSKDILNSVLYSFSGTIYDVITVSFAYYKNISISKTKYDISERKTLFLFKTFQMGSNYSKMIDRLH